MVDTVATAQASASPSTVRMRKDEFGGTHYSVAKKLNTTQMDPVEFAESVAGIKKEQAKAYNDKIDLNLKKIVKLQELKSISTTLNTVTQQLSNYLGVNRDLQATNLWRSKFPTLTYSDTGQDASAAVKITATADAPIRDFTFQVIQKAKNDVKTSTVDCPNLDAALNVQGTLSIAGQNLAITTDMTLNQIATAVNQLTSTTNVKMELVKVDATNYRFQLVSTKLGTPIDLTGTTALLATNLGVSTALTDATTLCLKAKYNGQDVVRTDSNFISDIVPGVTFEIYNTTTALNGKIDNDRLAIGKAFGDFQTAYNKLRKFAREQTAYEADKLTPSKDAYLHQSTTLRSLLSSAEITLTSSVAGLATMNNLSEIGIPVGKATFDSTSGSMTSFSDEIAIDAAKLDQLINSNQLAGVLGVVGNKSTTSNDNFPVYALPNFVNNSSLSGKNITVSISKVNGVIQATLTVDGITTNAEMVGDNLVKGPAGTAYEGLMVGVKKVVTDALIDNGAAATAVVSGTQGIFSKLQKAVDGFIAFQTGNIDTEIRQLETDNKQNKTQAESLEAQAKKEFERVMREFQQLRELEAQYQQFMESMDQIMNLMTARH